MLEEFYIIYLITYPHYPEQNSYPNIKLTVCISLSEGTPASPCVLHYWSTLLFGSDLNHSIYSLICCSNVSES